MPTAPFIAAVIAVSVADSIAIAGWQLSHGWGFVLDLQQRHDALEGLRALLEALSDCETAPGAAASSSNCIARAALCHRIL